MKDKLIGILNLKIEDINNNINNLKYLNLEIENNDNQVQYINKILEIFKDQDNNIDILNIINIEKKEFNKILDMVDSNIKEVFFSKSCNYDGIVYIIQGINQGISLTLTVEQSEAIFKLISSLENKLESLNIINNDLNISKNQLPIKSLNVLNDILDTYNEIINHFSNSEFISEIPEIIDALDFNNVSIEERMPLYVYLLEYNANVYKFRKGNQKIEEENIEDNDLEFILPEVTIPKFDYSNDLNTEEVPNFVDETVINNLTDFDKFNFELEDTVIDSNSKSVSIPITQSEEEQIENESIEVKKENDEVIETQPPVLDSILETKFELNLNEDTKFDKSDDLDVDFSIQNKNIDLKNILDKYNISNDIYDSLLSQNIDLVNISEVLSFLSVNKMLELVNQNEKLLLNILTLSNVSLLSEIIEIIKNDLSLDLNDYEMTLPIVISTIPAIFYKGNIYQSFIQNIKFYKEHNINIINIFDNYRELLIMDSNILISNYQIITNYQLELNNDNVKYLLSTKDISTKLDYYIETRVMEKRIFNKEEVFDGISYIQKYPYKINDINRDILLRLNFAIKSDYKIFGSKPGVLASEISNMKINTLIPDTTFNDLYFNNEYGFIDRAEFEKLSLEISNIEEFDLVVDNLINKLDSLYKESHLRYSINNLMFSRIKTIKIYNYLKDKLDSYKALLIALTFNSVILKEEYVKLEAIVKDIVLGGN